MWSAANQRAWACHLGRLPLECQLGVNRFGGEAADIYARHIPNTPRAVIDRAWDARLSKFKGFEPHVKFDPAGAQTVLDIRNQYGVPKKTSPIGAYVDESFYDQALRPR
jgi:hypothetical protein